jgi:hypothetical protein
MSGRHSRRRDPGRVIIAHAYVMWCVVVKL